jgi:threonylcarbamoyladenosine tRNA methylthiotransferase MtaB
MKVYFDCVGCRLNQSEIERMAYQVVQAGHEPVATPEECDLAIINTCSVTVAAASDSRSKVRGVYRRNREAQIVLTGCWSELEPDAAAALPGVVRLVNNARKDTLIPLIFGLPILEPNWERQERHAIPGLRSRTRAFIKVQDGCDNHCTYCLPTIARGASLSRSVDAIVAEIKSATRCGVKEVVLTGSQLSAYGLDLPSKIDLCTLIQSILDETKIQRVRLSSLEPWGLPKHLFTLMRGARVCRQLHIPLQSGCDDTLRRMGRPIRSDEYAQIILEARNTIPGLAVTTDIMVGFPGESEAEFHQSFTFIEKMRFARAHVFIYSPRPGTAAVHLPNHVPIQVTRNRSHAVRRIVGESGCAFRSEFIGAAMSVLWETSNGPGPSGCQLSGLTDNYIRVIAIGSEDLVNQVSLVRLHEMQGGRMRGELLS